MANDSGKYLEDDGPILPDYMSGFITAFGRACELSSNALNDQMRKALYPLLVGFQAAIEKVKIDTQLSCQNIFQEYIKGEVLPQIEKIVSEKLGPLTSKYEEQSQKLKDAVKKADESIETVVRTLFGELIKTILEPKLHEILGKFRAPLDAKIIAVDSKYSTEISKYGTEIADLRKSLEEIRANYKKIEVKPAEEKKPEEPKKETKSAEEKKPEEPKKETKPAEPQVSLSSLLADFDK